MANTITLPVAYTQALDLVFKLTALTGDLEVNASRVSIVGKEIKVPKLTMDGLADTTRGGDLVEGDISYTFETKTPDYDRNRVFKLDAVDEKELGGAFKFVASEFLRTKVIPEVDAVRFSKYASYSGIGSVAAALSTGAEVLAALRTAVNTLKEAEVPEGSILYITPTLYGLVKDLDTTKSKEVLSYFTKIVEVPQTRFYKGITLADGKTSGQEAGGYSKTATTGRNINFLVIHPTAILQATKHAQAKADAPDTRSDSWRTSYRLYGINEVYDNKKAAVYAHIHTS
jgi:hypothetical protein